MSMTEHELDSYIYYNEEFLVRVFNKDNVRVQRGRQSPKACKVLSYLINKGLLSQGYIGPTEIREIVDDLNIIYKNTSFTDSNVYSAIDKLYKKGYIDKYYRLEESKRPEKQEIWICDYMLIITANIELYDVFRKISFGGKKYSITKEDLDDNLILIKEWKKGKVNL